MHLALRSTRSLLFSRFTPADINPAFKRTLKMSPEAKSRYGYRTKAMDVVSGMDLSGKTYFITGANAGIGFETARAIALHGGHVIMGCRSVQRAQESREKITSEKPKAQIDLIKLDNENLQSVYSCAKEYIAKKWPLHCLILNAGIMEPEKRVTDDGFEACFQVNHLAHFLLTDLLTPLLIANAPSRVVSVSSWMHKRASSCKIKPEQVTWDFLSPTDPNKIPSMMKCYSKSKLYNVWFTSVLHARLAGKGVFVGTLHPGGIQTNLQQSSFSKISTTVLKPLLKTIEQGAATTVYCATAPELNPNNGGGEYYDDCKVGSVSASGRDSKSAERLWSLSEEMIRKHQSSRK